MKKLGILFGGRSSEHEISIISTQSILKNVDRDRYEPCLFPVDRAGRLYRGANAISFLKGEGAGDVRAASYDELMDMDVVFPVFHGPYGEDGTIQGLLSFLGVPYVGCGVESSAVCMHKGLFRDLMAMRKFDQPDYVYTDRSGWPALREVVPSRFQLPVFVKPCRGGSSIGISCVEDWDRLDTAVDAAFMYDRDVIIEEGISITEELEVAVFGSPGDLRVSNPGKLIAGDRFYTYNDKYVDSKTTFEIPAENLSDDIRDQIRVLSERVFTICDCFGLARVDFLYDRNAGRVALNEINTMPGFTEISMYPKLMMGTGMTFQELVTGLVELADQRNGV